MSAAADDDAAARTKGASSKDTMNQRGKSSSISSNLKAFYESHSVSVDSMLGDESSAQHRFIRLNPHLNEKETLSLIEQEISPASPQPIPWLDGFGFYAVPASVKLSQSECFRSGRVYGMDVSSGAAVAVLMSNKFDADKRTEKSDSSSRRVLDLCCAPGLKLCMLADMLVHKKDDSSMVVGVDIAPTRLNICKNIIKKYHSAHDAAATIRLYCGDGVTFGTVDKTLVFDSQVARDESKQAGKRKRMNKSARARERKRLKLIAGESSAKQQMQLFDRVLVDAECSTDGSLKHVQQQVKKKHGVIDNQQLMDEDKLNELVQLQKGLIASGYRLLKPGGTLVYSTCSLSTSQNEGVVQWLLDENKLDATLIELRFPEESFIVEGSVKGTVRFVPSSADAFCGGGFFVAKIAKKE